MNYSTSTVGEIVAGDYRTAQIFREFGLDFCCGGGAPVEEACAKKKVDSSLVLDALKGLDEKVSTGDNYNAWELDFLAEYIVNTHHSFVRGKLPEIGFYSNKVAHVHGSRHPELIEMYHLFEQLSVELSEHLQKEEDVLFPYIKELVRLKKNGEKLTTKPDFGTAANPVAMMKDEHETAGDIMEQIEQLSNGFTPPEDGCATYKVYFLNLEAFQKDLHKHVHLENNILFPKALALEEELKAE